MQEQLNQLIQLCIKGERHSQSKLYALLSPKMFAICMRYTILGMKPAYFNASAGVSLEYNVSKRIAVSITPSGNFALSAINKNAAVRSYPNSFGIGAGIKIKF